MGESKTRKVGVKTTTEKIKKCDRLMCAAAAIYVFIMMTVFPLFSTYAYRRVMQDKYYLFLGLTYVLGGAALVWLIARTTILLLDKRNRKALSEKQKVSSKKNISKSGSEDVKKSEALQADAKKETLWKRITSYFCLTDLFFLLFLLINIISTLLSDFPVDSLWGTSGRLVGCFAWIWMTVQYLAVSKLFRGRRWFFSVFIIVGVFISAWGILDTLGYNVFGWRGTLHLEEDYSIFS